MWQPPPSLGYTNYTGPTVQTHRALETYDILYLIFEYLANADENVGSERIFRHWLANAARVSHSFSEPAMTILWRKLGDIGALFRIFSSVTRECIPDSNRFTHYFRGDIYADEWRRFKTYAGWIREASYDHYFGRVDQSVIVAVANLNNSEPLLPSLRVLHWRHCSPNEIQIPFLLAPPHIQTLDIAFGLDNTSERIDGIREPRLDALLGMMAVRTPVLEHFQLLGFLDPSLLLSVRNLSKVRSMSIAFHDLIPFFDTPTLHALCQMDSLVSLELQFRLSVNTKLSELYFPRLESLHVNCKAPELARLLHAMSAPRLTNLSVKAKIHNVAHPCQDITHAAKIRFGRSLRTFKLVINDSCRSWGGNRSALFDIIRPLLDLRDMLKLELSVNTAQYNMNDMQIEVIAQSWPFLEDLSIVVPPLTVLVTGITLDSLVHFATHCPNLSSLELQGLTPTLTLDFVAQRLRPHNLASLYIRGPDMQSWTRGKAQQVAGMLYGLFPNLALFPPPRAGYELSGKWKQVMKAYAGIRGEPFPDIESD
ncbi:hypothetical protein OBBRIDRAFT_255451 [Obba rivulosa]|uniref:F-box domain-containing protein n=1 Tax=Obba rivulosa TaxID=1052685 RepID=A0A8E2AKD9_9APHY|nr:hypothetical protein OBBRIDRAFT_255451 [Obba rivulosa]